MSEKVEKSRKSSFPMFWGSGGSKSRLAKATGAEPKADERVDKLQNALVRGRKPQPQRAQRKTRQARPHQTETAAMVGPAQLLACRLRVLYKGNEAKVRRALKERFSPSRASQLLADTRQSLPRSWQQQSSGRQHRTPDIGFQGVKSDLRAQRLEFPQNKNCVVPQFSIIDLQTSDLKASKASFDLAFILAKALKSPQKNENRAKTELWNDKMRF